LRFTPVRLVLGVAGLVAGALLAVQSAGLPSAAATQHHRDRIDARIALYQEQFPTIHFVHLEGGERWHGEMIALVAALQGDVQPLDYRHPPALRESLMEVTLARLVGMLRGNVISSTAFRLPPGSPVGRPNLCVITLNPERLVTDDRESTRDMLELDEEAMTGLHADRLLDHHAHLDFVIDHEAFHCLDSVLAGGTPLIRRSFDGLYHQFRRESLADTFALAMHLRTQGVVTDYARNITLARALCLRAGGPNHCTSSSLRSLLVQDAAALQTLPVRDILALAGRAVDATLPGYQDYVDEQAAALKAAGHLGLGPYGPDWNVLAARAADPARIRQIEAAHHYYSAQLHSGGTIRFLAPGAEAAPVRE